MDAAMTAAEAATIEKTHRSSPGERAGQVLCRRCTAETNREVDWPCAPRLQLQRYWAITAAHRAADLAEGNPTSPPNGEIRPAWDPAPKQPRRPTHMSIWDVLILTGVVSGLATVLALVLVTWWR